MSKTNLDRILDELRHEFERGSSIPPEQVTIDSPLLAGVHKGEEMPQRYENYRHNYKYSDVTRGPRYPVPEEAEVREILATLDERGRWPTTGEWISEPYQVDEEGRPSNTAPLSVEHDHTAIVDETDQEYISTRVYIDNMMKLIRFLEQ